VRLTPTLLIVDLADGRCVSVPLHWYPRLAAGQPRERRHWRLIGDGDGIHWPDLDEDISVEGLLRGHRSAESATSLRRWRNMRLDVIGTTGGKATVETAVRRIR